MRFFARWRFPALITSAVILFAACGGSADAAPSVGAPQPSTAAPPELPEAKPAFAPKWSRPQEVNPAGMGQLDTYTLSNNERGMHVVVPQLTGHADLNAHMQDRKSTRLNSSHVAISYAVFCLKKKTPNYT